MVRKVGQMFDVESEQWEVGEGVGGGEEWCWFLMVSQDGEMLYSTHVANIFFGSVFGRDNGYLSSIKHDDTNLN